MVFRATRGRTTSGGSRLWVAVGVIPGLIMLSACSESSDGSSSEGDAADVETAQANIEAATGPIEWAAPGPEIDVSSLAGKRILAVTNGTSEFIDLVAQGYEEAADAVGADLTVVNANGLSDASRAIEQGIAADVDAIVINSWLTTQLEQSIRSASSKGIVVVQSNEIDAGPMNDLQKDTGVFGHVGPCYSCYGRLMADIIIADSGGGAHVLAVNSSETGTGTLEVDGFVDEMKQLCPDCEVEVEDVPVASWTTQLQTAASSALASDPELEYMAPVFDSMVQFMAPGVFARNAGDKVKFVSADGDPTPMRQMESGEPPLWVGNIGSSLTWQGWTVMDMAFRGLLGEAPATNDDTLEIRAFTPDNIGDLDLAGEQSSWFGDADFRSEFKSLWGL
jgi:ribose transport system substrate-binding protein